MIDIDKMTTGEWLSYRADKLTDFYQTGGKLVPNCECPQCDAANDYVCFDCEIEQVGE